MSGPTAVRWATSGPSAGPPARTRTGLARWLRPWLIVPVVLLVLTAGGLVVLVTLRSSEGTGGQGAGARVSQSTSPGTSSTPRSSAAAGVTVTYPGSDALLTNPERGFAHLIHCDESDLSSSQLRAYRTREGISLVWCMFYLKSFRSRDIDAAMLRRVQRQFSAVRAAGLKMVVRFAYTEDTVGDDATPSRVLRHIAQLKPYLRANADVILAVQAGFVGAWGEWAYTQNFGNDGVLTAADRRNRRAVLDALLGALPSNRMVQLRTPAFKRGFFGSAALGPGQAHAAAARARVGFHNDCFLASGTDVGTYASPPERPYLRQETRYVVMGGETCAVNPPRSTCPTALSELAQYHWTYLDVDYHPDVLASWRGGGCMTQVRRRLGYRLALVAGTYPVTASRAAGLRVRLRVRNDGWAAPVNPRSVQLVLRDGTGRVAARIRLPVDPRDWLPGSTVMIDKTVSLPASLRDGRYRLALALPDPVAGLAERPQYAIRTANAGLWDAAYGVNDLRHTITVTG